jgi:hypothetical protein
MITEKTTTMLSDETLEMVSGGWLGLGDAYTKEDYAKIGITWTSKIIGPDVYMLNNVRIVQDGAELACKLASKNSNHQLTQEQVKQITQTYKYRPFLQDLYEKI